MIKNHLPRLLGLLQRKLDLEYDRFTYPLSNLSNSQITNFLFNRIEARLRLTSPISYPIALQLEPTIQCQLDCSLCPRVKATENQKIGHMDWNNYEKLMKEIGPHLIAISFWQWGEPLLHPKIVDMVRLAKSFGIFTMISTNAQVDPEEFKVGELFLAGLDLLIISMDGASQQVYEKFRQGGKVDYVRRFTEAAVKSKKALKQKTPLINVRIIATSENEAEVEDVRIFSRDAGADVFSVKSVSLYYDGDPENPHLPQNKNYRSFQYQGKKEAREYAVLPNLCMKPWSWPTLRYDGTLLTCECDHSSTRPLGNVFSASSFREVWHSQEAKDLRKHFSRSGKIDLSFCQRCRYKLNDAIREIETFF